MNRHIILVTGSRKEESLARISIGINRAMILLSERECDIEHLDILLVHGGAKGADTVAASYMKSNGYQVKEFRADWNKHGKSAGPIRNQEMVEFCMVSTGSLGEYKSAVCVAFPLSDSIGTWDCIKRSIDHGIPVIIEPEEKHY